MNPVRTVPLLVALAIVPARPVAAQYPRPGGDEQEFGKGRRIGNAPPRAAPVISAVDLVGPPTPDEMQLMFKLTEEQAKQYTQVRDSFATVTKVDREAAQHRLDQLTNAVVSRDSAAVDYYRERLKELSKSLRDHQSRFDDRMKGLLNKDQQKEYKNWRKSQEEAAKKQGGRKADGYAP